MAIHIQLRRGSASAWTQANPILADGEPAVESDTGLLKIGNGIDRWVDLPYSSSQADAYTTLYTRTLDLSDIANRYFELPTTPSDASRVRLDLVGAGIQIAGRDFLLTGKVVSWNGREMESLVESGDEIVVMY